MVTDLVLEGNQISPEGVNHLVKAGWPDLRSINLSSSLSNQGNNNIEDSGLEVLCAGNWPKLAKLKIGMH